LWGNKEKTMSGEKYVGIWIEGLSEAQGQGDGPEAQEARARQYARSKGWTVRQVYHSEAKREGRLADNAEVKRLLNDVKSGRISGLIMNSLGSLARNTKELLELADNFKEHGADMIALEESIDTSTPAGQLFHTMVPVMAKWEREEISKRVKESVPERAKQGKSTGGQASFGYMWKDKKLVPNPKEAPVRRLIYELFLEHGRKKTVARILNEQGYRSRNGSKFSDTTITRLLRDPTAKGVRRANYTRSLKSEKQWELKSQENWIYSEVETIVSEELWEKCNGILDEIEKGTKKPARKGVKLFTGIAFCHCGGKMYMPSNSQKYICGKCRRKISKEDLEEIFRAQLKEIVKSSQPTAQLMSDAEGKIKEKEEQLQTLMEELSRTRKEMDKLFELLNEGEIPRKGFSRRYSPLEERLGNIEKHMPELQGELDYLRISSLSKNQLVKDSKELQTRWSNLTEEERRKIIETIIEKITIGEDEITLTLKPQPNP
jgi:site-specific DNA recombinase